MVPSCLPPQTLSQAAQQTQGTGHTPVSAHLGHVGVEGVTPRTAHLKQLLLNVAPPRPAPNIGPVEGISPFLLRGDNSSHFSSCHKDTQGDGI